jgi:uncharacterized protein (TIGR02996 family)
MMNERDALMQAILERPDEDGPYLVFADWLEEHGDAELARYVRLACEVEHLKKEDPRFAAAYDEFYALQDVGDRWADEWREGLPEEALAGLKIVEYSPRRGLYREAVINAAGVERIGPFRAAWERLLTHTPIRHIVIGPVSSAVVRFLATTPTLLRLRELEVEGDDQNGGYCTVRSVVQLARSPYLANLRRLRLYALLPWRRRSGDLSVDAIPAALAESPYLGNLESLSRFQWRRSLR